MYFKCKREDRSVPSRHHTSEKTSDHVRTSDPHESGEATKAGHELETAGQKRTNHLEQPQRPGHVIQGGRSCSTGPDQMEEETVRLMHHSAQEDISISISKLLRPPNFHRHCSGWLPLNQHCLHSVLQCSVLGGLS